MRDKLRTGTWLLVAGFLFMGGAKVDAVYAQSSSSALSPEAQQAMDRGLSAAKQGEWDLAIKYFSEARKATPTLPLALFNLALAYDNLGGKELIAIAWYRAYLASSPDSPNAQQVRKRVVDLDIKVEANVRKLIRRAREASSIIEDYQQGTERNVMLANTAYGELVKALAEVGDFSGAKSTAAGIRYDKDKSSAYQKIAEAQLKAGDIDGAKETAALITNENYKTRAQIEAQLNAGDIAGAMETAAGGKYGWAYLDIAWAQVKGGDIAGARETAVLIPEEERKFQVYSDIVEAQVKAGDIPGAKKTVALITDESDTSWAYQKIAEAQLKAGDIDGAKETAALITNENYKTRVQIEAQLNAGDIAGAGETAGLISDEERKSQVYSDIVEAHVKAEDISSAKKTAVRISNKEQKASAYTSIAETQAEAGDTSGARESFARAMEEVARIPDSDGGKDDAFEEIAEAQARAGFTAGAKRAAAAKAQTLAAGGMQYWTKYIQANHSYLSESAVADFKRFQESLEDKNPIQVTMALAEAAEDMAKALEEIRDKEAEWQKRRAGVTNELAYDLNRIRKNFRPDLIDEIGRRNYELLLRSDDEKQREYAREYGSYVKFKADNAAANKYLSSDLLMRGGAEEKRDAITHLKFRGHEILYTKRGKTTQVLLPNNLTGRDYDLAIKKIADMIISDRNPR